MNTGLSTLLWGAPGWLRDKLHGGSGGGGVHLGDQRRRRCCLPAAAAGFFSSSSSLSLKSSRLPMSVGLKLIRLARLCMSSSLRDRRGRSSSTGSRHPFLASPPALLTWLCPHAQRRRTATTAATPPPP